MRDTTPFSIKLTPDQATLISLLVTVGVALFLLVAGVMYSGQRIGQYAIIGLVSLVGVGFIFARPRLGIYLLIITIYSNMSTLLIAQGFPSINKPLAALILISILANRLFYRKPLPRMKLVEWAMVIYGCVWLLSGLVAANPYTSRLRIIDFAKDVLILLCVIWALENHRYWRRGVWVVIFSATALTLLSLYQIVTGDFGQTFWGFAGIKEDQVITELFQNRLSGPMGDPNYYAMMLTAVLPLAVYRVLDEKKILNRASAGICCALLIFTILNTYSRGALVAMLITGVLIALERRINPRILFSLGLMTVLSLPLLPEGYAARVLNLTNVVGENAAVQNEISVRGRTSELISGILMFVDYPVLGIGVGNYSDQYQRYAERLGLEYRAKAREAHSLYVEIVAETGILGILSFSLLMGGWFWYLRALRQNLLQQGRLVEAGWVVSLMMSVVSYLLCSIFLHGDYIRYLWLYISLGAAVIHLGVEPEEKAV